MAKYIKGTSHICECGADLTKGLRSISRSYSAIDGGRLDNDGKFVPVQYYGGRIYMTNITYRCIKCTKELTIAL
jgi:hypothetical protein